MLVPSSFDQTALGCCSNTLSCVAGQGVYQAQGVYQVQGVYPYFLANKGK